MNIVVIGAGLAGANAVGELRDQGYTEDITLIGAEPHLPYERPPLSKTVLLGSAEPDSVFVHDPQWYADQQVDLLTGTHVTGIDPDTCHVTMAGGQISYDRLLLATGSSPRRLSPDQAGADVVYLRTLDDALALRARLAGHILIIGAGWIGLEVAAAARLAGAAVTVVESAALPLERVLGPELAPLFAALHREHGVDLRLGTQVAALAPTSHGTTKVHLSDGHEVAVDLVLVGIGAQPDDQLATAAGLATENGILVDARLRSTDPHIYAAGDVANHDHPVIGRRIRVEHWDAAIHQGRHAARTMLGSDEAYIRQPYFFTDQYDLGMEYIGHVAPDGYDEVVIRGDLGTRVITAFWIRQDTIVAGMHVNDWDSIDTIRTWVGLEATGNIRNTRIALADIPV